jgi:hypothetical protein
MIDRLPLEFQPLAWWLRARVDLARTDERGEVVPWVIIVAVMATLALAVGAIVVAKVMSKANGINLNGNGGSSGG